MVTHSRTPPKPEGRGDGPPADRAGAGNLGRAGERRPDAAEARHKDRSKGKRTGGAGAKRAGHAAGAPAKRGEGMPADRSKGKRAGGAGAKRAGHAAAAPAKRGEGRPADRSKGKRAGGAGAKRAGHAAATPAKRGEGRPPDRSKGKRAGGAGAKRAGHTAGASARRGEGRPADSSKGKRAGFAGAKRAGPAEAKPAGPREARRAGRPEAEHGSPAEAKPAGGTGASPPAHGGAPRRELIRVLLVEENSGDARFLDQSLKEAVLARFDVTRISRLDEAMVRLQKEGSFDVVMLGLSLPDSQGLETFLALHRSHPEVPIVVLTGLSDELTGLAAVHAGAQDYLVKDQLQTRGLARAIRYAVERQRLLAELGRAVLREQAYLHEVDRLKTDMITFVAHEFHRTLTLFSDYGDALLTASPSNVHQIAKDFLAQVDAEMDRLARLIDSFLEISKGGGDAPIELAPETFDPAELVDEAVELARAATGKCEFKTHLAPGLEGVRADRERILQVLVNLLTNADHYSPAGGTVEVNVASSDGGLRFEVTSHRMKIPQERVEGLLESDAPDWRTRQQSGSGVHFSKRVVEAHGGRLGIHPARGRGTTFYFTLPPAP